MLCYPSLLFAQSFSGESIPIRLFLAGYDLTPTMRDVGKKFSVRYYLNLVLVDEEDRHYFKQQVSFENRSETIIFFPNFFSFVAIAQFPFPHFRSNRFLSCFESLTYLDFSLRYFSR